jgi:hypothetical protein
MTAFIYSDKHSDATASTRRRRYSAEAWSCLRGQIDRQHRLLAAAEPSSPRIRPTLASSAFEERE